MAKEKIKLVTAVALTAGGPIHGRMRAAGDVFTIPENVVSKIWMRPATKEEAAFVTADDKPSGADDESKAAIADLQVKLKAETARADKAESTLTKASKAHEELVAGLEAANKKIGEMEGAAAKVKAPPDPGGID